MIRVGGCLVIASLAFACSKSEPASRSKAPPTAAVGQWLCVVAEQYGRHDCYPPDHWKIKTTAPHDLRVTDTAWCLFETPPGNPAAPAGTLCVSTQAECTAWIEARQQTSFREESPRPCAELSSSEAYVEVAR